MNEVLNLIPNKRKCERSLEHLFIWLVHITVKTCNIIHDNIISYYVLSLLNVLYLFVSIYFSVCKWKINEKRYFTGRRNCRLNLNSIVYIILPTGVVYLHFNITIFDNFCACECISDLDNPIHLHNISLSVIHVIISCHVHVCNVFYIIIADNVHSRFQCAIVPTVIICVL